SSTGKIEEEGESRKRRNGVVYNEMRTLVSDRSSRINPTRTFSGAQNRGFANPTGFQESPAVVTLP
ncbi:MAG TPA: hypothetical protein VIH83_00290, partial [Candidatus Bathyarchaeia archaeon]